MNAEFMISAASPAQFPQTTLPEVAFAGRSNVGKSSMINKLLQRKNLVKTGNTPGKTRLVNFFSVENKFIFTDLPGYGYAAVSKAERNAWGKLIEEYFAKRFQLSLCVLLLDIRREPNDDDMMMFSAMNSSDVKIITVLTKTDKLSKSQAIRQRQIIANTLGTDISRLICFSALTGLGREDVWQEINALL